MLYLGIFGLELLETVVIFEVNSSDLFHCRVFCKNLKFVNLKPKMPYIYTQILGSNLE